MEIDITKKETYNYYLPTELIAQTPIEPRDHSRLLVYNKKTDLVEHKIFKDIINYLQPGDVLVVNNTKVIPARLYGTKVQTGAKLEVFLMKRNDINTWEVLVKPAKRIKVGQVIDFGETLTGTVMEEFDYGKKIIKFSYQGVFEEILTKIGHVPLPHYIKDNDFKNLARYNTVYSKINGSCAAPTAGLHFTEELLNDIRQKGIIVAEVLLHVGLGTFRPVNEENILTHEMHSEYVEVHPDVAEIINKAKSSGHRIIAVGTTSVRVLESCTNEQGILIPQKKDTNIFIYPGYKFKMVDALITNFHLPESTLIMLVSAFLGVEKTLELYNLAVKEKYRFYSFGDAMFLS